MGRPLGARDDVSTFLRDAGCEDATTAVSGAGSTRSRVISSISWRRAGGFAHVGGGGFVVGGDETTAPSKNIDSTLLGRSFPRAGDAGTRAPCSLSILHQRGATSPPCPLLHSLDASSPFSNRLRGAYLEAPTMSNSESRPLVRIGPRKPCVPSHGSKRRGSLSHPET